MKQTKIPTSLKRTILIGITLLILGCIITTYIISNYNVIDKKKDQVTSFIYYTDY